MRFINLEAVLPHIRDLLADLRAAQQAVMTEADPKRRATLINNNQARWTALRMSWRNPSGWQVDDVAHR